MIKSTEDIFKPVETELEQLNKNLKKMVIAEHPILYAAAEKLFSAGGKKIRPSLILLIAKETAINNSILDEHKRLAEITEIIHTASLVHDDVIDNAEKRRGINTIHHEFSNKIAILAGDFLFAQSSWYLANLGNLSVVQTISKVITDFAEGEVRQGTKYFDHKISIEEYIEKSFYKTASLIASSSKAATMISRSNIEIQNDFYLYGKHIGLAFQIIDDILDITSCSKDLGKPAGSDLKNGNLTAPLIFALEEQPSLYKFINREFEGNYDIKKTIEIIKNTRAIHKSKDLAEEHIQLAIKILKNNRSSTYITNLLIISYYILNRIN